MSDKEVRGTSAYRLCDKRERVIRTFSQMQAGKLDVFPTKFKCIFGQKYAFKVSMDEYHFKNLIRSFTIMKLSERSSKHSLQ